MVDKEKSADNTQRILDIQELVRDAEKRAADKSLLIETRESEVAALGQRLEKMRAELEAAEEEYKSSQKSVRVWQDDIEQDAVHVASLKAELEDLLAPYDQALAEMKAKLETEEARHIEQLLVSMVPFGWTVGQCHDAARTHIKSQPEWAWHEQCRLLIERVRKCEYTTHTESQFNALSSRLVMP